MLMSPPTKTRFSRTQHHGDEHEDALRRASNSKTKLRTPRGRGRRQLLPRPSSPRCSRSRGGWRRLRDFHRPRMIPNDAPSSLLVLHPTDAKNHRVFFPQMRQSAFRPTSRIQNLPRPPFFDQRDVIPLLGGRQVGFKIFRVLSAVPSARQSAPSRPTSPRTRQSASRPIFAPPFFATSFDGSFVSRQRPRK